MPNTTNTDSGSERQIQQKTQELEKRIARGEKWMIGFTGLIAASSIAYTIIAYFQWGITSAQLAEMRSGAADTRILVESTIKQADNTEKLATAASSQAAAAAMQAGAANEANKIAKDTLISADRPWVGISHTTIKDVEVGRTPTITSFIKNFGQTPALDVEEQSVFGLMRYNLSTNEMINFIKTRPVKRMGTIFPGQILLRDFVLGGTLTEQGINGIVAEKTELNKFGLIRYKDRFGGKVHHTWVYEFYDPKLKAVAHISRNGMPIDD